MAWRKILWLLIISCCRMNCECDNVKNRPQTAEVGFWKPNRRNRVFGFWILRSVRFGSVFRKPISKIFIRFHTPLKPRSRTQEYEINSARPRTQDHRLEDQDSRDWSGDRNNGLKTTLLTNTTSTNCTTTPRGCGVPVLKVSLKNFDFPCHFRWPDVIKLISQNLN